jgi:prepilin-type N-terminal cleavage/methylation domain-containing protein
MLDGKTKKGFTLIEVLIALAVTAVGLIALVTLFPVGLRSSRLAGDFTTASFVAQQALDNIRAAAQVNDSADTSFDSTNNNGLGYYDLPVSAVKGFLSPIRFPNQPERSQWWLIAMTNATAFSVTSSIYGLQSTTGNVNALYTSDKKDIQFILSDNVAGDELGGVYNHISDDNYPDFETGDELLINIEMHAGNPYYWYAMRAPMTEDVNLDGILGGRTRAAPYNQVNEDTGLDFIPDYWDKNNNGTYEAGLDQVGETGFDGTNDPHGDNRDINPNGSEGNGQIDSFDENDIQKVTVVVGWREGGQDRIETFSAAIPNQFR